MFGTNNNFPYYRSGFDIVRDATAERGEKQIGSKQLYLVRQSPNEVYVQSYRTPMFKVDVHTGRMTWLQSTLYSTTTRTHLNGIFSGMGVSAGGDQFRAGDARVSVRAGIEFDEDGFIYKVPGDIVEIRKTLIRKSIAPAIKVFKLLNKKIKAYDAILQGTPVDCPTTHTSADSVYEDMVREGEVTHELFTEFMRVCQGSNMLQMAKAVHQNWKRWNAKYLEEDITRQMYEPALAPGVTWEQATEGCSSEAT